MSAVLYSEDLHQQVAEKRLFRNLLPHSNLSQRERSKGKQPSFIQGAETHMRTMNSQAAFFRTLRGVGTLTVCGS